jgi:hypothetical protein
VSQNYATLAFIGVIFLAILGSVTFLTAVKAVDAQLIGQVVVAEVSAVAGLLAPSPLSIGKPPAP